ncbi:fimbria/pilus periplasmic chaperone [Pseudoxanthomonas daejeonensis]|nr:fimbria/pilus periplasmic chaperone [Pseudoxanthomonas daejeonensis]UNK56750.1 fimbria/pilus periplasmic chaperone [Pseudoxanthomonas daejeonensis]
MTLDQDRPRPPKGRGSRIRGWLLLAALALAGPAALAANLQVNPIMLEFAPGEQSQAVWLSNTGTEPLKAQVRVSAWSQAGGTDQTEPSRDLVASPAILEVAAGQQQLVRIIRPRSEPLQTEAAYRLTIDELPADGSEPQRSGLQFLLRYSVPVFVLAEGTEPLSPSRRTASTPPSTGTPTTLSARLEARGDASLLSITNPERQRVRLSNLVWVDTGGHRTELAPGLFGYVLAGQRMQWTIPLSPQQRANGGSLKVRFNDDPNDQTLPLENPGS